MIRIEVRDYTKKSPKGRNAGRRCTFYAVTATTVEEAKAKALRTHHRRIETGDLKPPVFLQGAGESFSRDKISYQIL